MKKTFALLLLLCLALGAQAQLLWKISGNGLERPSYIVGTHHLAPLCVKDSLKALPQAIEQTSQVYGEVVMDDMMKPETMQAMQQAMMLPADTTLRSLLTPAQYDSVAAVVKQYLGADLTLFDRLKPATVTTQLAVALGMNALPGFNPQEQLDTWFQSQARQAGKKVGGLETIGHQIDVLYNSQSSLRQARQLYCTATHIKQNIDQIQRLTRAYLTQDLDELLALTEEKMGNDCDSTPQEDEALIYGRNTNWAGLMPAIMQQAPTLFVVGAAHLPGSRGVLGLLRAKGYTVEPMK